MENKYYTPEREEFCIGFEYEFDNGEGWKKYVVNEPCPKPNLDEDYDKVTKKYLRVKYLDREDIESLGFEEDTFKGQRCYHNGRYLLFWYSDSGISIQDVDEADETENLFQGTIRNKSELAKLLKQLQVIPPTIE